MCLCTIYFREYLTMDFKQRFSSDMPSLKQNVFGNQLHVGLHHINQRTVSSQYADHFLLSSGL